MELHLQDPSDAESTYLIEEVISASLGADSGGAAFAFASAGGVRLLEGNSSFDDFVSRRPFDLVVGVDAVTDQAALNCLTAWARKRPHLSVSAFLTPLESSAIFHPKLCWFGRARSTEVLVGSGNLTVRGLRGNWEAFGRAVLHGADARQVRSDWSDWRVRNGPHIRPLTDAEVTARAASNRGFEGLPRPRGGPGGHVALIEREDGQISVVGHPPPTANVLVAELPKAGNRWNQANFSLSTFRDFFGAEPQQSHEVFFFNVSADGTRGTIERRPAVAVKSQNYRFELQAAKGRPYPRQGRPIVVFVLVAKRTFLYTLLLPGESGYQAVSSWLDTAYTGSARQVRRILTGLAELESWWPKSPLLP